MLKTKCLVKKNYLPMCTRKQKHFGPSHVKILVEARTETRKGAVLGLAREPSLAMEQRLLRGEARMGSHGKTVTVESVPNGPSRPWELITPTPDVAGMMMELRKLSPVG